MADPFDLDFSDPIYEDEEPRVSGAQPLLPSTPTPHASDTVDLDLSDPVYESDAVEIVKQRYRNVHESPDEASNIIQLSERTGLPRETVRNRKLDAERLANEPDWEMLQRTNPALVEAFAEDPDALALARDDIPNLNLLGQILLGAADFSGVAITPEVVKQLPATAAAAWPEMQARFAQFGAGTLDLTLGPYSRAAAEAGVLPEDVVGKMTGALKTRADIDLAVARAIEGDLTGFSPNELAALQGVKSSVQNLPAFGAIGAGTKALTALLATFGPLVGGAAFEQAEAAGLGPMQTLGFVSAEVAAEIGTELIPAMRLLGDLKVGSSLFKILMSQTMHQAWTEQISTVLSGFNQWMLINPEKTFGDFMAERPAEAKQTLIATVTSVGMTTGTAYGVSRITGLYGSEKKQVADAKAFENRIKEISQIAAESTLRERSPDKFASIVEKMLGHNKDANLYVNAKDFTEYFQSQGVNPLEVAGQLTGVAEQLPDALLKNGDLHIKASEYITHLGSSESALGMSDIMRAAPESMSAKEAAEWEKNEGERFQELVGQIEKDNEQNTEWQQSTDQVRTFIRDQITGTQRFDEQTAEKYAALHGAFSQVIAKRLGINPHEVYERFGLRVAGAPLIGEQLNQAIPSVTVAGREIPVTLPERAERIGESLVTLDTAKLEEAFQREEGFYVGPEGEGGIGKRYEGFAQFTETAASVEAPEIGVDAEGRISFTNGRHRFAYLRDQGVSQIPVALSEESKTNAIAAGMTPNILMQAVIPGGDAKQAKWVPNTDKSGKMKGAPEWVNETPEGMAEKDKPAHRRKNFNRMMRSLRKYIREGATGRYWYEESARAVMQIVGDDVVAAEKFIQLLAIYSPQASVQVNTYFAVRAWNHWKSGGSAADLSVKTGEQDAKAVGVLYNNTPFEGRKTGEGFYPNLMHEIFVQYPGEVHKLQLDQEVIDNMNATIDLWMYRAFGHKQESAGNDKGSGKYSFAEDAVRRLSAEMNLKLAPGEIAWTPHQVQAAIWSAMKARYEIPWVKNATWAESLAADLAWVDEDGKLRVPTTANELRKHRRIWYRHAMTVDSAAATEAARYSSASFEDFIDQMTQVITWEALPSASLGLDLFEASHSVKRMFTRRAMELILGPEGQDLVSAKLGVPLSWIAPGEGGYEGNLNPNNLSHILPTKESGVWSRAEVQAYTRIIQYIFKQDVVSWFRADPRALFSQAAQAEQLFRVQGTKGTTLPGSAFASQIEAQAFLDARVKADITLYKAGPNKGKWKSGVRGEDKQFLVFDTEAEAITSARTQYALRGGRYARGIALIFEQDLPIDRVDNVLTLLSKVGIDGLTKTAPNEISIINYRDDETGVPFMNDDTFADKVKSILEDAGSPEVERFWSEGEYGYKHDWKADPEGRNVLDQGGLAGLSNLHPWIRDRRKAFEALLGEYSADALALREQEAATLGGTGTYYQGSGRGTTQSGTGRGDTPPVREDGTVELVHWSRQDSLQELNPAFHGTGISGAESTRKKNDPENWVNRTYYGVAVGQGFGYRKEVGLGPHRYVAGVPAERLYDFHKDPENLYAAARDEGLETGGEVASIWERMIRDAGHAGYWVNHQQLGMSAAIFETLPTEGYLDEGAQVAFGQEARGAIQFPPDITQAPSVIALFEGKDLSTFIHETGHFFFEVYRDLASQPGADPQILADMTALLEFIGIADLDAWNSMSVEQRRDGHEKIARAFEVYLFGGDAPSPSLRDLFRTFAQWLTHVYDSVRSLGVELTPEVREVFDRMLATEEEIRAVEVMRQYAPLFESIEQAGMTLEAWAEYQALGTEATGVAGATLSGKSLKDMQWLSRARSRELKRLQREVADKRKAVAAEAEEEIYSQPLYAARRYLTHGDREPITPNNVTRRLAEALSLENHKLSKEALVSMYGSDPAALWRYLPTGKYGMMAQQGIHPNELAEIFGFSSIGGDALVRQLLEATPPEEAIESLTDTMMMERYGDVSNPQVMEAEADKAVHNDARVRFMATELKALDSLLKVRGDTGQVDARGRRKTYDVLARAAKDYAEAAIGRKTVRLAGRTAEYTAAETRAGRAAQKAMLAKDIESAAQHKRAQLLNAHFFRAAARAGDDIGKIHRYLKKFGNEGTRKNLSQDYLDQIDQLLERYDLRKGVTQQEIKARTNLAEWVAEQHRLGFTPAVPQKMLDDASRQHYSEMTYDEFKGLRDAVKSIDHLGRLKKKLLTARDQREFDAIIDDAVASVEDNSTGALPMEIETDLPQDRAKRAAGEYFAMHIKLAETLRNMDGGKDNGAMVRLIMQPLNTASDNETAMRRETTQAMHELFAALHRRGRLYQQSPAPGVPGLPNGITKMGRVMVALNLGNATNRQRIRDGYGWSDEHIDLVTSELTREDWDFVQGMLNLVGSFKEQIKAKAIRVNGVEPVWVEATPIQTPYGEYPGGYFPLKYNSDISAKAHSNMLKDLADATRQGAVGRAMTKHGHEIQRVEDVKMPVLLDFRVITMHLEQVIHDLAMHEYMIDVGRILNDKRLQGAIVTHYGMRTYEQIMDAMQAVAAGDVPATNVAERAANWARSGASIAAMGWKLWTAALQPIGLTQSMQRIGTKWVGRGIAHWIAGPDHQQSTVDWIHSKSKMMKHRGEGLTLQREINDIRNTLERETWFTEQLDKTAQAVGLDAAPDVASSFFYLIAKLQMVADVPTWLGQYEKSMSEGLDETSAIAVADQAVLDSQGGGQVKDLAKLQRGSPFFKLWTNFYSYFNVTMNRSASVIRRTDFKSPSSVGIMAVDLMLLQTLPVVFTTIMYELAKNTCGDDWRCISRRFIDDQVGYLLGNFFGLREMQAAATGYDYQGPAGARVIGALTKASKQIAQGEIDKAMLKSTNEALGVLFHYPSGQINATAEGTLALINGDTKNPAAVGFGLGYGR